VLKYCAWCGEYQGATESPGHQIRKHVSEIDTSTICPVCREDLWAQFSDDDFLPA